MFSLRAASSWPHECLEAGWLSLEGATQDSEADRPSFGNYKVLGTSTTVLLTRREESRSTTPFKGIRLLLKGGVLMITFVDIKKNPPVVVYGTLGGCVWYLGDANKMSGELDRQSLFL